MKKVRPWTAVSGLLRPLGLLLWLGCGNEPRPPVEPAPELPAAPPAAKAIEAEPPEPTAAELPVPEDFAPEAEQTITKANFHAELDALEHELNAEPALVAP